MVRIKLAGETVQPALLGKFVGADLVSDVPCEKRRAFAYLHDFPAKLRFRQFAVKGRTGLEAKPLKGRKQLSVRHDVMHHGIERRVRKRLKFLDRRIAVGADREERLAVDQAALAVVDLHATARHCLHARKADLRLADAPVADIQPASYFLRPLGEPPYIQRN